MTYPQNWDLESLPEMESGQWIWPKMWDYVSYALSLLDLPDFIVIPKVVGEALPAHWRGGLCSCIFPFHQ